MIKSIADSLLVLGILAFFFWLTTKSGLEDPAPDFEKKLGIATIIVFLISFFFFAFDWVVSKC